MRITKEIYQSGLPARFFKATLQGVRKCFFTVTIDHVGFMCDNVFTEIRPDNPPDLWVFDQNHFFSTEREAVAAHRELVIENIANLNCTSLKDCPIDVQS